MMLQASFNALNWMLRSKSFLTSPERNPVVRFLLRETFYKQFCGGENKRQVQRCLNDMKHVGYHGAIIESALEVLEEVEGSDTARDVDFWRKSTLEMVDMVNPGDFVGLK